ncbi:hypothetical protein [Dyadobacter tibetensis]|uniref:hypothetical protein n=1 Tax=Dyadobacter tibetensis TaxID=1211851 RepID=UPI00046F7B6C|nr:hypothetical protein [Dyadobacter tibetensis]
MRITTLVFLFAFWAEFSGFGQIVQNPVSGSGALSSPVKSYKAATAFSQNLYNGRIYYWYDYRSEEHQFYKDSEWHMGQVFYDGQQHDSIPLKYDVFKDQLLIRHLNGDHMILQTPKISWFSIDDHRFQYLTKEGGLPAGMISSFYDQVFIGKTSFLVLRKKDRQEKIVDKKVVSFYPVKDRYYLLIDGIYREVRSKKSVRSLFPGQERILRKALREAQIPFRQNREAAILLMVQHSEQVAL